MVSLAKKLVSRFPHLNLAHIHDALAYYYDNRDEIQQDLDTNREQHVRQRP